MFKYTLNIFALPLQYENFHWELNNQPLSHDHDDNEAKLGSDIVNFH